MRDEFAFERDQVPITRRGGRAKPRRWQQQPARQIVGHLFASVGRCGAGVDAESAKHTMGIVLTHFVRHGPMTTLDAGFGPHQDHSARATANAQPSRPHVSGAPLLTGVFGDGELLGAGKVPTVDRRCVNAGPTEQFLDYLVQCGVQFFGSEFRCHRFALQSNSVQAYTNRLRATLPASSLKKLTSSLHPAPYCKD